MSSYRPSASDHAERTDRAERAERGGERPPSSADKDAKDFRDRGDRDRDRDRNYPASDPYGGYGAAGENGSHAGRDSAYADAHGAYDGWDARREHDYWAYYRGYGHPREYGYDRDRYDYYRGPPSPGRRDDYYGYYGRGPSPPPPHYGHAAYERGAAPPARDDSVSYRPGYSREVRGGRDDDFRRDRDRFDRRDYPPRRDDRRPMGPRSDRAHDPQLETSSTLFVGNLPYSFREDDVRKLFERFGKLANVTLTMDRVSGHNKGFAFVKFEDRASAVEAYRGTDGTSVEGRRLRLDWDSGRAGSHSLPGGDSYRRRSPSPRGYGGAGSGYASYYTAGADGTSQTAAPEGDREWSRRSPPAAGH